MWENYQATIIQNAYRKYLKCERDTLTPCKIKLTITSQNKSGTLKRKNKYVEIGSPIDPLYRSAYNEKKRFRIIEWHSSGKPAIWHFNIDTLIDWLNTSKQWINPMTNCLFLNSTIDKIILHLEAKGNGRLKLAPSYNLQEKGIVKIPKVSTKKASTIKPVEIWINLIKSVDEGDETKCKNLLKDHYDKILNDTLILDDSIHREIELEELNETLYSAGILHLAVLKGNLEIVKQLLYFGISLEKRCLINGYTALHLSAMINREDIGKILILYGANIDSTCHFQGKISNIFEICDFFGNYEFIESIIS